ncbi:MAG TPA: cold shock domain-containing protein, partial [Bacteroidales bacterium]|nr:cold shock domain-containing protein [Bacteroidales bacterium]
TDVDRDSIELNVNRNNQDAPPEYERKGVVTFFNESKGFGFIRDMESGQSYFVHVNSLLEPVKENNIVVFEAGKGPKGPAAMKVKLFKE